MTVLIRIQDTLNCTASLGEVAGTDETLRTLTNAINRTVLPQRIEVRFKNGDELHLLIHNRRLHQVATQGGANALGKDKLGPEDLDDVVQVLKDRRIHEITHMHSVSLGGGLPLGGIGLSAASLLERLIPGWDKTPTSSLEERLTHFATDYPNRVEASFAMVGDEMAAVTGSNDAVERLSPPVAEVLAKVTDEAFTVAGSLETDGLLSLRHRSIPGGCLLIVGQIGTLGVLVLRDMGPDEALALWQS